MLLVALHVVRLLEADGTSRTCRHVLCAGLVSPGAKLSRCHVRVRAALFEPRTSTFE